MIRSTDEIDEAVVADSTSLNRIRTSVSPTAGTSPERVMQLAWSYAPTLIMEAALEHRVFDLLKDEPKAAHEVAREAQASERGIIAILNALVGLNFLQRDGDLYSLTPESAEYLVSSSPNYRGKIFHHAVRHLIPKWTQLSESVRTGRPVVAVNEEKDGAEFFSEFVESLFPLSETAALTLARHLNLEHVRQPISVLDIGAGSGVWGITLAKESPEIEIHAVDWPKVLNVTRRVAEKHGVADRLTTIPGDLMEADFGRGHHVATIGHILHSEGAERSRALLRKTYKALAQGGTIAIAEWLPNNERTGPPSALIFAVNMLVHTEKGDTYTYAEISEWLHEAGFRTPRLLEIPGPCPLIIATK